MKIITVIDDDRGMMFNNRRQSQDSILRKKILEMCQGSVLYMNEYTAKQFGDVLTERAELSQDVEQNRQIRISETFLGEAGAGEYCMVEDRNFIEYASRIDELILFRWNRKYPGDLHLEFRPEENNMKCVKTEEFPGSSHEKITMEVWKSETV